jgi:ribosomal protein S12 methylthiotransferase
VNFVALGCPKNLVDSEKMLGLLAEQGFILVSADDPAEVMIINTCGFIEDARQEAFENIELALERKRAGEIQKVVVTGCLAQYWGQRLAKHLPGIDLILGLAERDQIVQAITQSLRNGTLDTTSSDCIVRGRGEHSIQHSDQARLRLTDNCWAYLRISEGCNQGCTFCTIPEIRGKFRSKPVDAILAEAHELVHDGVVELNLIGQETTAYGSDSDYKSSLGNLLRQLNQIPSLEWIRVHYGHPASIQSEYIQAMADCSKVVPYLDLPLQHINDRILKLMRRHVTRSQTEKLLQQLRQDIVCLTLRTTMIVGFPSETDEEFAELLKFVEEFQFQALGAVAYSAEEGTPAARMPGQVCEEIKQERLERLMLAQQEIAFEQAKGMIGSSVPCLITSELEEDDAVELGLDTQHRWYVGRHLGQAAEIDSECYVSAGNKDVINTGTIRDTIITHQWDYDLVGEIL